MKQRDKTTSKGDSGNAVKVERWSAVAFRVAGRRSAASKFCDRSSGSLPGTVIFTVTSSAPS